MRTSPAGVGGIQGFKASLGRLREVHVLSIIVGRREGDPYAQARASVRRSGERMVAGGVAVRRGRGTVGRNVVNGGHVFECLWKPEKRQERASRAISCRSVGPPRAEGGEAAKVRWPSGEAARNTWQRTQLGFVPPSSPSHSSLTAEHLAWTFAKNKGTLTARTRTLAQPQKRSYDHARLRCGFDRQPLSGFDRSVVPAGCSPRPALPAVSCSSSLLPVADGVCAGRLGWPRSRALIGGCSHPPAPAVAASSLPPSAAAPSFFSSPTAATQNLSNDELRRREELAWRRRRPSLASRD